MALPFFTRPVVFDDVSDRVIEDEPMFFGASAQFARSHGGPLTRVFVDALERDNVSPLESVLIDTKTCLLRPSWYACEPGWHQDAPVWSDIDSRHALCLVDDGVCPTEFLHPATFNMSVCEERESAFNQAIEREIDSGRSSIVLAPTGCMIYFDGYAIHRCTAAKKSGWRWRARATWQTSRRIENKILARTHVYVPIKGETNDRTM